MKHSEGSRMQSFGPWFILAVGGEAADDDDLLLAWAAATAI